MRVIVIGAGVVGLSAAYFLADAGHEVVVLERDEPGGGASSHNAGWVAPSMAAPVAAPGMLGQAIRWMVRRDSPLYVRPGLDPGYLGFLLRMLAATRVARYEEGVRTLMRFARGALPAYDRLCADGLDILQDEQPLTMLFTDPASLEAHAAELAEAERAGVGIRWERLDRAAVVSAIPGASEPVVGALVTHGDRTVDPVVLMRELADACRRRGVEIVPGATAAFELEDGAPRIRHAGGIVAGDAYVVAAGVWSGELVRPLGARLPLAAGKGYGFDLPPVADLAGGPVYLAEGRVAITPYPDRLRLSGTMGFGGADPRIDRRRAGGILSSVDRYLGGYGISATAGEPWMGLRPMTPDGIPIIQRLPRHPSVIIAAGHQMMGVTLGPVTGLEIVKLMESRGA
ncbi:MAG: FAD-dependent oxidoreductase [Protaetiibacter sp.]